MSWTTTAALGALASTAAVASAALIASPAVSHEPRPTNATRIGALAPARSVATAPTSVATIDRPIVSAVNPGVIQGIIGQLDGPPSINVTWPQPGAFLRFPAVLVQGTVSAPAGISIFTINGTPVTPSDAAGNFQEWVPLPVVGMNPIDFVVTDNQNRSTKSSLAVLCGGYLDATAPVDKGLELRLNQGTFAAVSQAISQKLSGQEITDSLMAQNPISSSSGWWGSSTISATCASFGNPVVTLTPEPGDIHVHVDVPSIGIDFQEIGSWNIPNVSGSISCDDAAFDAQVTVAVVNGQLQTAIQNDGVNLVNFNWGINGLPGFLTDLFKGAIQNAIQSKVAGVLKNRLPPEINSMLAAETGQALTQSLLGQTATYGLTPDSVTVDGSGLTATVGVNCQMTPVPGYSPLPAPGSLTSYGSVPQLGGPGPDLFASIDDDLLNRFGLVAWQAGVLNLHLDGTPGSSLPSSSFFPTDLGALQTFIPELDAAGNASDPIAIDVTPLLPPVFSSRPAPHPPLTAQFGQLLVTITDQANGSTVLELIVHASVPLHVSDVSNSLYVSAADGAQLDVTIVESSVPLNNEVGIDNIASLFLPSTLEQALSSMSGFPLPVYPGLTPWATSIYGDGPQETYLTAAANFGPNGPALPRSGN